MKISRNGRVVIVDDKIEEVLPLFSILSKKGIPFIYITGDRQDELPLDDSDFDSRFIFLDINLSAVTSEKNIVSTLFPILNSLLKKEQQPYVLIIWSKKDKEYIEKVYELFENDLKYKKPLSILNLEKSNYFQLNTENGKYELIDDAFDQIEKKIYDELKTIDALELLVDYENISNLSLSEVINDIFILTKDEADKNITLKNIYYKLTRAFWGKQLEGMDDKLIAESTMIVLNSLLADTNETNIVDGYKPGIINKIEKPKEFSLEAISQINKKLLIGKASAKIQILPGNLYAIVDNESKKQLINDAIDRSQFMEDFAKSKSLNIKDILEDGWLKKEYSREFNKYGFSVGIPNIVNESLYVELEVSPVCDYTQKKLVFNRILPGVIIQDENTKYLKKATDYLYLFPLFEHDNKLVRLLFDFRYLKSVDLKYLDGKTLIFKIRHLPLVDIQAQLSRHVNRPGVIYLD